MPLLNRFRSHLIAGLAGLALAGPSRADGGSDAQAVGAEVAGGGAAGAGPRVGGDLSALAAAVMPGVLVHGAGHWGLGERDTARRLFLASGAGLGLAAAGGVPLLLSGASRRFSGPGAALVVSGLSVFALSWVADIYGAAGGGSVFGAYQPPRPVRLELGYAHVRDPQFAYDHFAVLGADLQDGRLRVSPSAWIAMDDDNQRLRAELAWSLWRGAGGSRLELAGALTHHRYGGDFFTSVVELSLLGRLDLERVGPTLRGSFAELSTGAGLELFGYDGVDDYDLNDMLLGRFGFGFYLGQRGELALYYDHRRDDIAGGLTPSPRGGSGFVGHVGTSAQLWLSERWGATAELMAGAALVGRVGLMVRLGGAGR